MATLPALAVAMAKVKDASIFELFPIGVARGSRAKRTVSAFPTQNDRKSKSVMNCSVPTIELKMVFFLS